MKTDEAFGLEFGSFTRRYLGIQHRYAHHGNTHSQDDGERRKIICRLE